MTRRQIKAKAFDETHRRLMLAYRNACGGEKSKAKANLDAYVTSLLPKRDA